MMYRYVVHGRKGATMMAISAVDCALWDLQGPHAANRRSTGSWAARPATEIPAYASMLGFSLEPGDGRRARAPSIVGQGYQAPEVVLPPRPDRRPGGHGPQRRAGRSVREAVGADVDIMFDCLDVAGTSPTRSRWPSGWRSTSPRWIEEPVLPDKIESYADDPPPSPRADLRRRARVHPLGHQAVDGRRQAVDVLQPDIYWCGGITEMLKICALASAYDLPVVPHGHSTQRHGSPDRLAAADALPDPGVPDQVERDPPVLPEDAAGAAGRGGNACRRRRAWAWTWTRPRSRSGATSAGSSAPGPDDRCVRRHWLSSSHSWRRCWPPARGWARLTPASIRASAGRMPSGWPARCSRAPCPTARRGASRPGSGTPAPDQGDTWDATISVRYGIGRTVAPGGPFPLIVFSHGYQASPTNYGRLLAHLASHGFVVAGPEHQDCRAQCTAQNREAEVDSRPADVSAVLDGLLALNDGDDPTFHHLVDPARVGMAGQSFGGWTTLTVLERDPRFRAGLAMAPATAIAPPPDPTKVSRPTMLMAGMLDAMVTYALTTRFFAEIPGVRAGPLPAGRQTHGAPVQRPNASRARDDRLPDVDAPGADPGDDGPRRDGLSTAVRRRAPPDRPSAWHRR